MSWREVDEALLQYALEREKIVDNKGTYPASKDNLGQTLRIPKELVNVIIANYIGMVPLLAHKLAINDFVSLISHEPVKGLDDRLKIQALFDGFDPILTLRAPVIIIRAFEDKAQALRYESDVARLAPEEQIQGNLP